MKKFWMVVLLFACCAFAFAGNRKDTLFDVLADASEKNLPEGASLRRCKAERIIFIDLALPIKSTDPFDEATARAQMLQALKGTPDAKIIKEADILLICNFITTDYKIHSFVFSKKDL